MIKYILCFILLIGCTQEHKIQQPTYIFIGTSLYVCDEVEILNGKYYLNNCKNRPGNKINSIINATNFFF